jgi:hypothetical protein
VTPDDVAEKRPAVEAAAEAAGRVIDPEHWGALIIYTATNGLDGRLAQVIERRRPGLDPATLVPSGYDALRAQCERFIEKGFSKLVVLPAFAVDDWTAELERLAEAVVSLTT